jgi:hypothetical protein
MMKCNFNASSMPNDEIETLRSKFFGIPRTNVLELTSCSYKDVIFKDEASVLKLSGNCSIGHVTNGEIEYADKAHG